ncbi:MAG: FUN14 domain-containing protein [Candidatus Nitrosopolaris sp.]
MGGELLRSFILNSSQNKGTKENEVLISNIIPFAGSGLIGYAIGFALKKILKWMLIIVGFLVGMFFVGVQLLQKYGHVSAVNWDYLP